MWLWGVVGDGGGMVGGLGWLWLMVSDGGWWWGGDG